MKVLEQFKLSLNAIREGKLELSFQVSGSFFTAFANDLIGDCDIVQKVSVEKTSDFYLLHLSHTGHIVTDCDRCLETIKLPVGGYKKFILKYGDGIQEDEDEIIYLHPEQDYFDFAPLVNEVITLRLPLVRTYKCEDDPRAPCNPVVLEYLNPHATQENESSPVWEELKNLDLKD